MTGCTHIHSAKNPAKALVKPDLFVSASVGTTQFQLAIMSGIVRAVRSGDLKMVAGEMQKPVTKRLYVHEWMGSSISMHSCWKTGSINAADSPSHMRACY